MQPSPLYWLLDVELYDFDIGVLKKTELTGKVLIVSSQLWSIIRGSSVHSMLIGPGFFKGVATSGNRRVEVSEHLSALMFDPTRFRYDEPVPLVDIIKPEVIDPLTIRKPEELVTMVRNLIVEKGNVLAINPVASVKGEGSVPQTAHYNEILQRISVSHISGTQRTRFILGGTNRPLYKPLVEWFNIGKYNNPERNKIMATPFNRFSNFSDIEIMSDWMIVEKAGVGGTGVEAIRGEYESILASVQKNADSFIFEL